MAKQKENNTSEQASAQNRLNDALSKGREILKEIKSIESDSLDNYFDRLDMSKKLNEDAKILASITQQIEKYSTMNSDRAKALTSQYEMHKDLLSDVQSKYADVLKNSQNIASSSFEMVDLSQQLSDLADQQLDLELSRDVIGKREYERQKKLLEIISERLENVELINQQQLRGNELAQKFLNENNLIGKTLTKTLDGIGSFAGKFGGDGIIGSILGNKATELLDKTKSDIESKIVQAFQMSGEAGVGAFKMARIAAGSFVKFALPALGIVGILGLFYGMIKAVGHLDEELKEIGHEFGVSRKEADKIHHLSIDIAKEMKLVGINSKEVAEGLLKTSEIMNGLNLVPLLKGGNEAAMQLVKDVTVLTEKLHMSAEEAANIQNISVIMNKPIGQIVKESVKLGKGLFTAKESMKMIGKISPAMAINFRKGSIEMIKTAQQAKLLGLELDDIQSFGDGILDFETSLAKEMEARVLTGRNINFDLARQYALNNDISGLQEEMLHQLGSLNEFEKMNYLQRKSISEAFGMSVDQVAELLTNQEKLVGLGITQEKLADLQSSNAEKLRKEAEKMTNAKLREYTLTLAKEKEVATINERISDAVKKIKEVLASTLAPLLEQVHAFLDSAEGAEFIKSAVSGVKSLLTGTISVIKTIASGISGVNKLFGGTGVAVAGILGVLGTIATYFVGKALIVNGVKSLIGLFGSATSAASGLSSTVQTISGAAAGAGGQIASLGSGLSSFTKNAIGMLAAAGALFILAKAIQEFKKVETEDMSKAALAIAGLTATVYALSKIQKDALAGSAAMILLAGTLYAVGMSLKPFMEIKWEDMAKAGVALLALTGAVFGLGSILASGVGAVAFGVGIAGFIALSVAVDLLGRSLKILADAMKTLGQIGDLKGLGKNLAEGFKELGKIPKMINIDYLKSRFSELSGALNELDFSDLVAFGDLAKADMKNAGKKIAEGIESLANISTEIDLGSGGNMFEVKTGVIASLAKFNAAIGQLELDGVKAFIELAKTDLSKIGPTIQSGIDSLASIKVGESTNILRQVEGVFDLFEDMTSELDYEEIDKFTSISVDGMISFAEKFGTFITKLSQSSAMAKQALTQTKNSFAILDELIDKMEETKDKMDSMGGVRGFVGSVIKGYEKVVGFLENQGSVKVSAAQSTTATGTGGGESEQSKMNKKLDQLITLMGQVANASNQPSYTVVKFGDRTIETIANGIEAKKQQNPTRTGGKIVVAQ